MPVREKTENILFFFLKNEGYIDLVFSKMKLPNSTKHKLLYQDANLYLMHV